MNLLSWIFQQKKENIETDDPIWSQIPETQVSEYQRFFGKLLLSVDLDLNTRWSRGINVDISALDRDSEIQSEISKQAKDAGLNEMALQIMLWQYFFADELLRSVDTPNWAQRVRNRQPTDYFPASDVIFDRIMNEHQNR
jgi:hypothetical protein